MSRQACILQGTRFIYSIKIIGCLTPNRLHIFFHTIMNIFQQNLQENYLVCWKMGWNNSRYTYDGHQHPKITELEATRVKSNWQCIQCHWPNSSAIPVLTLMLWHLIESKAILRRIKLKSLHYCWVMENIRSWFGVWNIVFSIKVDCDSRSLKNMLAITCIITPYCSVHKCLDIRCIWLYANRVFG